MRKRAKNEVLGYFLNISRFDLSDIAYFDITNCSSQLSDDEPYVWHNLFSIISIIYAEEETKMRFLAIFLSLVAWIDLKRHTKFPKIQVNHKFRV